MALRFAAMSLPLGGFLGLFAGCGFDGSQVPTDGQVADAAVDAKIDAPMVRCAGYDVVASAPATSRYRRLSVAKVAAEQAAECSRDGGHLIVLDNAAEVAAMQLYAPMRNGYYTVGLSDAATEGSWITAKGAAATFLPWATGQPDGGFAQNCAVVSGGSLYDYFCNIQWPAVCECE